MTPPAWLPLAELPGRDAARDAAERELRKRTYDEAQPPLINRALAWVFEKVQELLASAAGSVPGGQLGVLLILLLVALIVGLVVVRLRPTMRSPHSAELFGSGQMLTAAEHRDRAENAAAAGDLAEAVRERLRAVVRSLEERGVLDARPGRTAAEVSAEAGRVIPALTASLHRGATVFEQIWYGGQVADATSYQVLVEVDTTVQATRMVPR